MNKLCFAVLGLVVYGSLWPFDFLLPDGEPYRDFLNTIHRDYSRQDLIENVILFFPVGLFGLLGARTIDLVRRRLILVMVAGSGAALALQIAQIYVRLRVPDLNDALWNSAGLGLGAATAWLFWRVARAPFWHRLDMPVVPAVLFGAWAVYRLAPFAPSFNLHSLQASLAPLLATPTFRPEVILHDVVGWLVIAHLVASSISPSRRSLLVVMGGFFFLEWLIIYNTITPSEVLAAIIASALWCSGAAHVIPRARGLLVLLSGIILVDVIWPFPLANGALVFLGPDSLGTAASKPLSILVVVANKVFLYGSCAYVLRASLFPGGQGREPRQQLH